MSYDHEYDPDLLERHLAYYATPPQPDPNDPDVVDTVLSFTLILLSDEKKVFARDDLVAKYRELSEGSPVATDANIRAGVERLIVAESLTVHGDELRWL